MLNKAKILKKYKLNCSDGEIGKVKDFYFDDQTWIIRYLVVNTGNWLIGRQVLVSPHSIVSVNKEEESININLTKSQIENSPILDSEKPVSKQFQKEFNEYFEYPMSFGMIGYGGVGMTIPYNLAKTGKEKTTEKNEDENRGDPHLRSTHFVRGYGIQSLDDEIGHVEDFVMDVETWEIHYLQIDTKKWLPGRKVLISSKWIDRVSWTDSIVFVNLSSDEIEKSPEYTNDTILDRGFETELHKHYNRTAYWLDKQEVKDNTIK
jgi:hypothetical protein